MRWVLIIVVAALASCSTSYRLVPGNPTRHKCGYKTCPYKKETRFRHGCGYCDSHTACRSLDSLHFHYPNKSYDYIDSIYSLINK